MPERTWARGALIILLLLEVWAFSGSFHKYFNHDSLFYLIKRPRSVDGFARLLAGPDDSRQYRPLTLGVMALVVPLAGTDPRPYHCIPLIFHAANTVLFYMLARRLLSTRTGALFAAAFWGFHSVAGWITYDITCISDFMVAFLCLSSLLLAIEGQERRSLLWTAGSLIVFLMALLTKEPALPFPLALWLVLGLVHLRRNGGTRIRRAFWIPLPTVAAAACISALFAALFARWLRAGILYAQGTGAAYDIDPWSNIAGKLKYLYWALNLPDALHVGNPARARTVVLVLMGTIVLAWGIEVLRRRRLSPVQWGGLVWLFGMMLPALMLSSRVAKWYLYVPLLGLALALGDVVPDVVSSLPGRMRNAAAPVVLTVAAASVLFSSRIQTLSYVAVSDAAYVSDMLESFVADVRRSNPVLPEGAQLFVLPALEKRDDDTIRALARLLSSPPIEHGELLDLYYPGTRVRVVFAHGEAAPNGSGVHIMQYLDGRLYDVTKYFQAGRRLVMFLLPTLEKTMPPRLLLKPEGGDALHEIYTTIRFADRGAQLAPDYFKDTALWIVQYLNGHFYDVTDYYKSDRRSPGLRPVRDLSSLKADVNRAEFYPDYLNYGTPNGKPVFFPTPDCDIVTQIGGSSVTVPPFLVPPGAVLRFDVSWMYDSGDGGWGELQLVRAGTSATLFRQYFRANPKGSGFHWKRLRVDLSRYAGETASLVLKCYNDRGHNTVSDWLNWRDITLEANE